MATKITTIEYKAKDCCEIISTEDKTPAADDVFLTEILRNASENIKTFNFSNKKKQLDEESYIVDYDYKESRWKAGRYIGEVTLKKEKKQYSLSIVPRFGESILLEMLGEIFHMKLPGGASKTDTDKSSFYLKLLISYLWAEKLSSAIRHGLPRTKKTIVNTGFSVKGRLRLIQSAFLIRKSSTVASETEEYCYDLTVLKILSEAHRILVKNYFFELLENHSIAFKEVIKDIELLSKEYKYPKVSEKEYQSIIYRPIYQEYKEVVDFSWTIIQSSTGSSASNTGISVSGYLLDMAEIWECYLRTVLNNRLKTYHWELVETNPMMYKDKFYQRTIIPDIVFRKGNAYCVFDAKYKRMAFNNLDVDRTDFFQIHTYISYLQSIGNVTIAGLLYPVETTKKIETLSKLFGNDKSSCWFIVDGPITTSTDSKWTIDCSFLIEKIDSVLCPEK